ncbi:MAG: hypothetical protein ABWZ83_06465 [Mesorhizobium sp.]|jgi:hypothetical protein
MDVELFLQGVIRFSNFITSRLLVSGVVFYVLSGFVPLGNASEGILPSVDLLNQVVQNYQNIFDILGVSDFALLLILFIFMTTIHLIYVAFASVGFYLPPAIVPLSGWTAIDDITWKGFQTLREARGKRHTEDENQRLYEFSKKLRQIEIDSDERTRDKVQGPLATFRISKTFVVFSLAVWIYAQVSGNYAGNKSYLLIILLVAAITAILAALSIFRMNHQRISSLREDVVAELLEFSRIWVSEEHQRKVAADCVPTRELKPAALTIAVPVFGTLDALMKDLRKWRSRRS